MQTAHTVHPKQLIDAHLCHTPAALSFSAFLAPTDGGADQAATSVAARVQRQPAGSHHRIKFTAEGGRIDLQRPRQITGAHGAKSEHTGQQRVLRPLEPRFADLSVIVLRHMTQQLPRLEIGAALGAKNRRRWRGGNKVYLLIVATIFVCTT